MTKQQEINHRWIGVAACDWTASSLLTDFYTEEVPSEWYLTWYANLAMAVVLPPARWQPATPVIVADWLDQIQENFWFYLLCETAEQVAQAADLIYLFKGKCGGLVLPLSLVDFAANIPVDVLYLGREVLLYRAENLREGRKQIIAWLEQGDVAQHGLILLDDAVAYQIKEVQMMLTLIGENSDK
jgi:hypothetical protein